ncbi:MAG: SPOR domain-containing protein [Acidobacteria bacterium]|nr:SPOR domain-containing protein [Acidobacteriota bacterium]
MSDAEEPSYYEIALTNRQVLIAFTILLVCMLTSFFAGLWVGRGDGQASAAPPPSTAVAQTADGGEELPEFKFFSDTEDGSGEAAEPEVREVQTRPAPETAAEPATPPPPPPAKAEPAKPSTLAEDVLGDDDGAEDEDVPPARKPATPPPPPPARTVPEEPAAQTNPALPRTTVRRPPSEGEELYIQVFSSRDEAQANKVLERLKGGGFAAFLSPVEVDNQTMYRVRVGPFADRASAEQVAQKVRSSQRLDTWITP